MRTLVGTHLHPFSKLVAQLSNPLTIGPKNPMTTLFSSLSLRLKPPILAHSTTAIASTSWSLTKFGTSSPLLVLTVSLNCSHSLFHSHDPPSGYPLTTQIKPLPLIGKLSGVFEKSRAYIQSLEICALVRVRASCAPPCWKKHGGCRRGKEAESYHGLFPLPKLRVLGVKRGYFSSDHSPISLSSNITTQENSFRVVEQVKV